MFVLAVHWLLQQDQKLTTLDIVFRSAQNDHQSINTLHMDSRHILMPPQAKNSLLWKYHFSIFLIIGTMQQVSKLRHVKITLFIVQMKRLL